MRVYELRKLIRDKAGIPPGLQVRRFTRVDEVCAPLVAWEQIPRCLQLCSPHLIEIGPLSRAAPPHPCRSRFIEIELRRQESRGFSEDARAVRYQILAREVSGLGHHDQEVLGDCICIGCRQGSSTPGAGSSRAECAVALVCRGRHVYKSSVFKKKKSISLLHTFNAAYEKSNEGDNPVRHCRSR